MNMARDEECHFRTIKWPIYQVEITILNGSTHSNRASKFLKQKWTELRDLEKPTIGAGNANTALAVICRTSRQKISKNVEHWDTAIHQLDPTDVDRLFRPTASECTLSSRAHAQTRFGPVLTSLSKIIKSVSVLFSFD